MAYKRTQFGLFLEKILAMDPDVLRAEYFRPDEGMRIYHMGRTPIMQLAEEAGALYKINRHVLINKKRLMRIFKNTELRKERLVMKKESIRALSQIKALADADGQFKRYMRVQEATRNYQLDRRVLQEIAIDCGALYKINSITLRNMFSSYSVNGFWEFSDSKD